MNTFLRNSRIFTVVFFIANMFLVNVAFGQTVTLDQADLDYAPGETVYITGTGWQPGETVTLQVDNLTDPDVDCGVVDPEPHELWTTVADGAGNFTASWYVNDCELGADLLLGAFGVSSGFTYEIFFTDANSALAFTSPSTAAYGSIINLSATLTQQGGGAGAGSLLSGKTISFSINGTNANNDGAVLNSATTVAGVASVSVPISNAVGTYNSHAGLRARFSGDPLNNPYSGSVATNSFEITKAITIFSRITGSGIYGGSVTLTATTNLNVAGLPIIFTLDGISVGSSNTNASGVATLSVPFALIPSTVKNVGTYLNKVGVSIANTLNYSAVNATGSLSITKKDITGNFTADNKVYDGNTVATVLTQTLNGVISPDVVSLTGGTASFDNKNVGNGKTVTSLGMILSGSQAGNYSLTSVGTTTANIAAKTIIVTAQTDTKSYDGTASSSSVPVVTGLIAPDAIGTAPTQVYDNRNVGTGKVMTASGLVINDGNSGGNYDISYVTNTSGIINKITATVTAQTDTKSYDGTASSSSVPVVTGLIAPDAIGTAPTQVYDNRNVGTGKVMTASGLVINDGNSGGNYDISYVTNTSGIINKITATVTAQTDTKSYDGTASSSSVPVVTGLIAPDAIGTAPTQVYDNRNVGTGKVMTASGLVINDGNSGGNYDISYVTNTSGIINKITATVTAQTDTKSYDGTASSSSVPVVTGLIAPDAIGTAPTQVYDNRNVGTGKVMTASGLVINDGNSGGNYDISYVTNTSGIINKITATVTAQTDTKSYDGTASSSSVPVVTGLIAPDAIGTAPTQVYDNRNVGTGKVMTASGLVINDGNSGGNYDISYVTNTSGIINKITATVTAQTDTKSYDGTASSSSVPVVTGLIAPDAIGTAPTQVYDNRNVGTGKVMTASGLVINDGNSGGNYDISYVTNTSGIINKITATVTAQTDTKSYDGTASSSSVPVVTGLIAPDAIGTAPTQVYDNRNVGTGKVMTASGLVINDGNSGGNYDISYVTNTSGIINKITATVTATAASKYCGQNDPIFTGTLSGFIAGDNVTASYSRIPGETADRSYDISATLSPLAVLGNYDIIYATAAFTINGLLIDASASSTPVAIGQSATLYAIVSPVVSGVTVKFYVDGIEKGSDDTNSLGIATYTLTGLTTTDVYKIEAVAGTGGCASTAAYLPVYDPNGAFVTGGGWINSPAGAMPANTDIIGKANFGFVSKYKKGSSIVDGNTEFQFHAGDINFKSTMHESGSLVISGAKATYRGTGTINGLSGYKFTIVAIDGHWNNGSEPDRFRIKITTTSGTVIYDNQIGKDDNADDATVLAGGSIVIHEVKKKGTAKEVTDEKVAIIAEKPAVDSLFDVMVYPNPSVDQFTVVVEGSSTENVTVAVFDVLGRLLKTIEKKDGETIQFGEDLPTGSYIAKISQGAESKTVQLIKK